MYSQHPELAKEFEAATPKGAKFPQHVSDKKSKNSNEKLEKQVGKALKKK